MIQEGYQHIVGTTGFLLIKVPQEILNELKLSVDDIQNDFNKAIPLNNKLAGQIDKEYATKLNPKATQYIKSLPEQYCNTNPSYLDEIGKLYNDIPNLKYNGDVWINFQKKYEYNPIHDHTGVFSYVIWYQIPFYKENEIKYGAGKGRKVNDNNNGDFGFVFPYGNNSLTHYLPIDKTMEGYMAMFPSSLKHVVYPFYTSDDYRITISGNIYLGN